jgi:DNA adenine methylase
MPNTKTHAKSIPLLSPLRYPGSKRKLVGYLRQVIEANNLHPELFVEPFAGGASVALQLLRDDVVHNIGLIELDPLVASFWEVVFHDAEWLMGQVETIDVTIEKWHDFKQKQADGQLLTNRARALACLFLNRTNFSGFMARNVGPIGGRSQNSKYKIDCRFTKPTLIHRIKQISAYQDRVEFVWNCSWADGLADVRRSQAAGDFPQNILFYLDPPFFEQAETLYTHYFTDNDHRDLRDELLQLEMPWILSYDSVAKVKELYNGDKANSAHIELLYNGSALNGGKKAREVIITNLEHLPGDTQIRPKRVRHKTAPYLEGNRG